MSYHRRQFFRVLGAGALATYVKPGLAAEPLRRTIPSTGEVLPAIGLGTSRTFNVGTDAAGRGPLAQVLRQFHARGGRLIDTSPMYGRAERVIGELAAQARFGDELFFATKVWVEGRAAGIEQMRESMRLLKTPVIDLMQVHNLLDTATHLKTLRAWKEAGHVRYIGITHYQVSAHEALARWVRREPLDFVQVNASILTRDAEDRLLPLCADRGVAVLVNRPFERGSLFRAVRGRELPAWAAQFDCHSWAQFFLKYLLGNPAVTCPIPATSRPGHLVDNMGAAFGRVPGPRTRGRMVALIRDL